MAIHRASEQLYGVYEPQVRCRHSGLAAKTCWMLFLASAFWVIMPSLKAQESESISVSVSITKMASDGALKNASVTVAGTSIPIEDDASSASGSVQVKKGEPFKIEYHGIHGTPKSEQCYLRVKLEVDHCNHEIFKGQEKKGKDEEFEGVLISGSTTWNPVSENDLSVGPPDESEENDQGNDGDDPDFDDSDCQSCSGGGGGGGGGGDPPAPPNMDSFVDVSYGAGRGSGGISLGFIKAKIPVGTSSSFSAAMFEFLPGRSPDAEVIYNAGVIKQVYGPDGLTVFNELSGGIVEVKFYAIDVVGAKVGGFYTVTGNAHTTYRIEPSTSSGMAGFIYSVTKNGQTVTHKYYATSGPTGKLTRHVQPDGKIIERSTSLDVHPTNTTIWSRVVEIREMVVINGNEVTVSEVIEEYASRGHGEFLDRRFVDPNGDNLTTQYAYYENINEPRIFGRKKSIIEPSGKWVSYEYDASGRVVKESRPWKDLPADPDDSTSLNSRIITREYDGSGALSKEEEFLPHPSLGSVQIRKLLIVENPADEEAHGSGAWSLYTVAKEHWHGSGVGTKSILESTSYMADFSGLNVRKGDFYRQIRPTGVANRQMEERGNFAGGVFTPNVNGAFTKKTVVEGTLAETLGVTKRTTRTTTISDFKGPHLVIVEVYVGSGAYEKITETAYTYEADEQRRMLSKSVDGVVVESWNYNGISEVTHTNTFGVQTVNTLDDDGTLIESVKVGVEANINNLGNQAQGDITTTYATSGLVSIATTTAGALTSSNSTTLDYAGRTVSRTDSWGRTETISYTNGGREETETLPGGLTRVTSYYLDGRLKSVSGTGAIHEFHEYEVDANGNLVHTKYNGTSNNTSPRWKKTVTNGLKQVIREQTPGPNGPPIVVEYDYENETGLLVKKEQTGLADTLYEYDSNLNQPAFQGIDINNNGSLDLVSADVLSKRALEYEKDGNGDWWLVNTSSRYLKDGDAQDVATMISKRKLGTGVNSVIETIGADGNSSLTSIVVDRVHKAVTTTTTSELSTVNAVSLQINGLLLSQSSLTVTSPVLYRYDALGRLVQQIDRRTTEAAIRVYNTVGQVSSATDAEGNTTNYTYYGNAHANSGMLATQTNQEGEVVRYAYDNLGRLSHQWGGGAYPLSYTYNAYGDLTHLRTYQAAGDWSSASLPASFGTAPPSVTTWGYHLGSGLLTSKTDDSNETVSYTYEDSGLLDTRTWARGVATAYDYDAAGRVILIDYSDSTPDVAIGYRRDGQRTTATDAAGTHVYTYHADLGAPATETVTGGLHNGLALAWSVDVKGRPNGYSATLNSAQLSVVSYGYDATSRLNSVAGGVQSAEYGYLANSDLLHTTTLKNSGVTRLTGTRIYDDANRLTSIGWVNSAAATVSSHTYGYDGANRRERADLSDGSYWEYGYNDKGEVTSGVKKTLGGSIYPGLAQGYTFDEIGNRLTATVDAEGGGVRTTSYTPNKLNQYSAITHPSSFDVTGAAAETAVVKVNTQTSQRLGKYFRKELPASNSGQPVWANVDIEVTLPGLGLGGGDIVTNRNGHRYVAPTPESPDFDEDGNLVSDGRWIYTWDAENRLIAMETIPTAVTVGVPKRKLVFAYDGGSHRIAKQVYEWDSGANTWTLSRERRFIYDQWNLMVEVDGNNTLLKTHTWGLDLSLARQGVGGVGGLLWSTNYDSGSNSAYFPAYDGNGNVSGLIGAASGNCEARYEYDAFGRTVLVEGGAVADGNSYRFSTKYEDAESELYYYGYRYYSTAMGRWLNKDPIEENGGHNLYAINLNNVVNGWDILGQVGSGNGAYLPGITPGLPNPNYVNVPSNVTPDGPNPFDQLFWPFGPEDGQDMGQEDWFEMFYGTQIEEQKQSFINIINNRIREQCASMPNTIADFGVDVSLPQGYWFAQTSMGGTYFMATGIVIQWDADGKWNWDGTMRVTDGLGFNNSGGFETIQYYLLGSGGPHIFPERSVIRGEWSISGDGCCDK